LGNTLKSHIRLGANNLETIYRWITVIKETYLLIGAGLVALFVLKSLAGSIMNKFVKKKLIKHKNE
jgi:hypothetical protein